MVLNITRWQCRRLRTLGNRLDNRPCHEVARVQLLLSAPSDPAASFKGSSAAGLDWGKLQYRHQTCKRCLMILKSKCTILRVIMLLLVLAGNVICLLTKDKIQHDNSRSAHFCLTIVLMVLSLRWMQTFKGRSGTFCLVKLTWTMWPKFYPNKVLLLYKPSCTFNVQSCSDIEENAATFCKEQV